MVSEDGIKLFEKRDFQNVIILLFVGLAIGVYLIATTVIISKDSIFYIQQAQKLQTDPVSAVNKHYIGYPALIFLAHKFAALFSNSSSIFVWIYSAQTVSLLCRLFSIIFLYFTGKLLIGGRRSFWAIFILLLLPYPAEIGSEVLRDWPHILFLSIGLFSLLYGAKQGKWWLFGIAGFASGLGHIVRPECVQIIIYGSLWLIISLFRQRHKMSRLKSIFALSILLIGFAVPITPYIIAKDAIVPPKLGGLLNKSTPSKSEVIEEKESDNDYDTNSENIALTSVLKVFGKLIERINEHLMYFFMLPFVIGSYNRLRKSSAATEVERFFMSAFLVTNVILMILLYCEYEYIGRRHCMPIPVFLIFYVVVGIEILGNWLGGLKTKGRTGVAGDLRRYFFVFLITGIIICLPKLFRPIRIEKQGYKDVANWLRENTTLEETIVVPRERISFYAERKAFSYTRRMVFTRTGYIVKMFENEDEHLEFNKRIQNNAILVNSSIDNKEVISQPDGFRSHITALTFNGPKDVIDTDLCMNEASDITLSAWVKSKSASQTREIIASSIWAGKDYFFIGSKNDKWCAALCWGDNQIHVLTSESTYIPGEWYHVACAADISEQKLRLYVNGGLSNEKKIDSTGAFHNVARWSTGGSHRGYFNGSIDNAMVFERVLSTDEIKLLSNEVDGREEILRPFEILVNANTLVCNRELVEKFSVWVDKRKKKKMFAVYRVE